MRHRPEAAAMTGLGNPAQAILDNEWTGSEKDDAVIRAMLDEAIKLYFQEYGGCDFTISKHCVRFGIEPSYMYQHLKMIHIDREKGSSYFQQGIAWGGWGSDIASNKKWYSDYKKRGKFVKFIDEWHPRLFS